MREPGFLNTKIRRHEGAKKRRKRRRCEEGLDDWDRHDFGLRAPLTIVRLSADLLQTGRRGRRPSDEELDKSLEGISDSVTGMNAVLTRYLQTQATLDGSLGYRGPVSDLLPDLLRWADMTCVTGSMNLYRTIRRQMEQVRLSAEPNFLYGTSDVE